MTNRKGAVYLELQRVDHIGTSADQIQELVFVTNNGHIQGRYHLTPQTATTAVIWVGGAGGGLDGPAGGLYPRLAGMLATDNIASLRLHYRFPNQLYDCVLDTLLGVEFLYQQGHKRIALAGHSFGGAVVISAGAASDKVTAVAALSSQTYGTNQAAQVSPRPLLLMHGTADEILPDACSRDIYTRAKDPKQILLYPGCRHGLDECRDQVDQDLLQWLKQSLTSIAS